MNRYARIFASFTPFFLTACGAEAPEGTADPNVVHLDLGTFTVPQGESFMCYYTDTITTKELSVISATGLQGPGGHHLSMYYVDNERPVGPTPCSGTKEMVDWHFVVGGGGENGAEGIITLDKGLAIKIPVGKQLMVQAHYINTRGVEETVHDTMDIQLTDPADVKAYAADFVVDNDAFEIPAHAPLESTSVCKVDQDLQLAVLLPHMHEHGKHFKLEMLDAQGNLSKTLIDTDWFANYASHPPVQVFTMDKPLVIPAGSQLRQTCMWNNTSDTSLIFPTEMCIGFGYYFPGNTRILCEQTP
ncbi:MAG TPA: hypothetical protein PK156_08645 [Polyangium sp.]|nr:hypothetical protein [Polyangium sp.]